MRRVRKNKQFLSFTAARKFSSELGIKSWKQWVQYCFDEKKPCDIPSNPDKVYKYSGWKNWHDWLGYCKKYHIDKNCFKTWSHDMA